MFNDEALRLFWRFISDEGTFTASSTSEGYDVDNLKLPSPSSLWMSGEFGSDLSETITIDLGSVQTVSAFALLNHTLEADDTIVLRYASDSGFTVDVGAVSLTYRVDDLLEFFTAVSRRYWRLEVDLASGAGIDETRSAGRLVLGDHYQFERNLALEFVIGRGLDLSRKTISEGGVLHVDIGEKLRILSGSIIGVGEADRDEWEALAGSFGTAIPFLLVMDWETYPARRSLYGVLDELLATKNVAGDKWTITLAMTEAK